MGNGLGQDEFSDPGGGVLTSWFDPNTGQEIVSAPAVIAGDTGAAGPSASGVADFFSSLFSKSNLQSVLGIAERYGIAKPIVGYTSDGKPIYASTVVPLSTTGAAYSTLTQVGPLGLSMGAWLLLGVGGVLVLPRLFGGKRK